MAPAISVIVPVYNVEAYLKRCLDSISAQTMGDIEIIIVNDGTKDDSREVAKNATLRDPRMRIIDQENQGLGYARNTGLNVAAGEYVSFIDSDDWVDPGYLEAFYLEAERTKADLVIGTFTAVTSNERETSSYYLDPALRYKDVPFNWREAREIFLTPTPVWDKFYRRSLIEDNGFRFPKLASEDIPFKWKTMTAAARISTLPEPYYYYRVRNSSLTGGKKNAIDVFRSHDVARRYLIEKGLYQELYPEWAVREINELIYLTVKARRALLGDSVFFSAFHALLQKAVRNIDFVRARHLLHYVSDEYMFRARYLCEHDGEEDFRNILVRACSEFDARPSVGTTIRLGSQEISVAKYRANDGPVQAGTALPAHARSEFFRSNLQISIPTEYYPDEPRYRAANVENGVAYILPPIYDASMAPAHVSFVLSARRPLRRLSCMVHTYQRERTVPLAARLEIRDAVTDKVIGEASAVFEVDDWYKLFSVALPDVDQGTKLDVRVSALNAGEMPAYFTGIRFYDFVLE